MEHSMCSGECMENGWQKSLQKMLVFSSSLICFNSLDFFSLNKLVNLRQAGEANVYITL